MYFYDIIGAPPFEYDFRSQEDRKLRKMLLTSKLQTNNMSYGVIFSRFW